MKSTFTALIASIALTVQAQFGPFEQFFNQTIWNDLPAYDSISVWYSAKAPANLATIVSLQFGNDGKLDSMIQHDVYSQQDAIRYSGKRLSNKHVLVSYVDYGSGFNPEERYTFIYDQNLVKEIYIDTYNGSYFEESVLFTVNYNNQGRVENMVLSVSSGTGHLPMANYSYTYNVSQLEKVEISYYGGAPTRKFEFTYGPDGKLLSTLLKENNLGNGLQPTHKTDHFYTDNEMTMIEEYWYDDANGIFELDYIAEYSSLEDGSMSTKDGPKIHLSVYPNPVHDFLKVKGLDIVSYRLYDRNGLGLQKGKLNGGIDVRRLSPGVYILQVYNSKGQSESIKFMKK